MEVNKEELKNIKSATQIKDKTGTVLTTKVKKKKKKKGKTKPKKEWTNDERLILLCKIMGAIIFIHLFINFYLALRR